MVISKQNLTDTCTFIVSQYSRHANEDLKFNSQHHYKIAHAKLSGLSLLLVSYKEKKIVDDALAKLVRAQKQATAKTQEELPMAVQA